MIIDTFYEDYIKVVFSYLPAWEMFFSMHVLSKPEHHTSRKNWVESKEKYFPELVKRIQDLGPVTDSWNMIIDSAGWGEIRQMEIEEILSLFRGKNIYQWNEWIAYTGRNISIEERNIVMEVMEQYYNTVFQREEIVLRAFIRRILQEEKDKCRRDGLWTWCMNVHPRLCIEPDVVIYKKNHEYRIEKKEIGAVYITVSTFVTPHLWLYYNHNELEVVKGIVVEQEKNEIPADLVWLFKALGEPTRLQIIKHLLHGVCTTQALAQEMMISEAAISRHLKLLQKAGFVKKTKKGFYMEYRFETDRIDYIPYMFYETMLLKQ